MVTFGLTRGIKQHLKEKWLLIFEWFKDIFAISLQWLQSLSARAWSFILFFAVACVILVAFVLPYDNKLGICDPYDTDCDFITAWGDSIRRLGIEPVFPPEEDVQVGDIYAVLKSGQDVGLPSVLLGRSAKLYHDDMSDDISKFYSDLFTFPSTQDGQNSSNEPIFSLKARHALPIVLFPSVTLKYRRRSGGAISAAGQALGIVEEATDSETISIPAAETYGVPVPYAVYRLNNYCKRNEETCSDDNVRSALAYALGEDVAMARDKCDNFLFDVEIYMLYRVYLARSIIQERSTSGTLDTRGTLILTLKAALDDIQARQLSMGPEVGSGPKEQPGELGARLIQPSPEAKAQQDALAAEQQRLERLLQEVAGTGPGGSVDISLAGDRSIRTSQTFARPVTVGFRAVRLGTKGRKKEVKPC